MPLAATTPLMDNRQKFKFKTFHKSKIAPFFVTKFHKTILTKNCKEDTNNLAITTFSLYIEGAIEKNRTTVQLGLVLNSFG
jgi:hypothetical protein